MLPSFGIKHFTDQLSKPGQVDSKDAIEACLIVFVSYFFMAITRFGWRYYLALNSRKMESQFKKFILDKILHSPYYKAQSLNTGETISHLSSDIANIQQFLGPGIVILLDMITYLIVVPVTLFLVVGPMVLWMIIPFIFVTIAILILRKPMHQSYTNISDLLGSISDHIYDEAVGARFMKLFNLTDIREKKYYQMVDKLMANNIKVNWLGIILELVIDIVVLISFSILFYLCFFYPKAVITIGALAVAINLLEKMIWPMMAISYVVNIFQRSFASAKKLAPYLDLPDYHHFSVDDKNLSVIKSIEIQSFNFSFPGQNQFELSIPYFKSLEGQKIGIIGKVGSGKSTLLKILAGLHSLNNEQEEKIKINGINIGEINLSSIQNNLSYIPQHPQVFTSTLRHNIQVNRYSQEDKIYSTLAFADLTKDVASFTHGLDTLIGEKGINLSGGQKQRLNIARSLYFQPQLFLWDDCISALDYATEEKIIKNIFDLNPKAILILATQRIQSLKNFDQLYFFEDGKITAHGTYQELEKFSGFSDLIAYENKTRAIHGE